MPGGKDLEGKGERPGKGEKWQSEDEWTRAGEPRAHGGGGHLE